MSDVQILTGDALETLRSLPSESVHCCVTSPPYWNLRDYGNPNQLGAESTPEGYVQNLVDVIREVRRVLHESGTLWLNLGSTFERKQLIPIPWMVGIALQRDRWWLRSDCLWIKANAMPSSVTDRPTPSHEYMLLLSKKPRYFFDADAVAEPAVSTHGSGNGFARPVQIARGGRGKEEKWSPTATRKIRTAWHINTQPYAGAHFAVFPERLAEIPILAGTSQYGCCPKCLSPWKRKIEKTGMLDESAKGSRFDVGKTGINGEGRVQGGERYLKACVGWNPTCKCGTQETAPCVVLDPFAGSGTTGVVAAKHGRNAVLIELNPDYVGLIEKRVHGVQRVFPMEMAG